MIQIHTKQLSSSGKLPEFLNWTLFSHNTSSHQEHRRKSFNCYFNQFFLAAYTSERNFSRLKILMGQRSGVVLGSSSELFPHSSCWGNQRAGKGWKPSPNKNHPTYSISYIYIVYLEVWQQLNYRSTFWKTLQWKRHLKDDKTVPRA